MSKNEDNTPTIGGQPDPQRVHLRFLESLGKVDRAIRATDETDEMLSEVLDVVLAIFECDRAYLLFPCDPESETWSIPMERTVPEFPGALELGVALPTDEGSAEVFRMALGSAGPIRFDPEAVNNVEPDANEAFTVRSQLLTALYPKLGKPWVFGIHQCTHARVWTDQDVELLQEIGRRLADGLSNLLFLRDLKESEQRFRAITENTTDITLIVDEAGICTYASPSVESVFGLVASAMVGSRPVERVLETDRARFSSAIVSAVSIAGAPVWLDELRAVPTDGDHAVLDASLVAMPHIPSVNGVVINCRDVTRRRKAEQDRERLAKQLRHASKMQAVGQLAAGVAHDFNNLLTAILGNATLAMHPLESEDPQRERLSAICSAANLAAALTRQLLAFGAKQIVEPRVLVLNELIEQLDGLLRGVIGEDIEMQRELAKEANCVEADPSQLEQVLLNLCVNARDAMPDGGKLSIETSGVVLDEDRRAAHPQAKAGKYVTLSVSDTGVGMDEATKQRLFEPFFTTKHRQQGTGLGLSTLYGIVKQLGGFVEVDSEPGRGSTFRVHFPVVAPVVSAAADSQPAAEDSPRGAETVLVVEDEEQVRIVTESALEMLGYQVLTATSGAVAVELSDRYEHVIDVLMTDVVMPKMDGRELADLLRKKRPDIEVLFTSGYSEDLMADRGIIDGVIHFIAKPYTIEQLAEKMRVVLDGPASREHA